MLTSVEAAAAAGAVGQLFGKWGLSEEEARAILGGVSTQVFEQLKAGKVGQVDEELSIRLSLLLGIHKGLRSLFRDPERGHTWVRRPNLGFEGRTPVKMMVEGGIPSLARVRAYLDAERHG